MISEIRAIEDYSLADIYIYDCQNATLADAVKWNIPAMKKGNVLFYVSLEKNFVLSKSYNPSYLQSQEETA
jgi:hypothetical protein